MLKIASYNVENLFQRATALSSAVDDATAEATLDDQAEVNGILRQADYSPADKARILELLTNLGLRKTDDGEKGKFAILRQNRGQLIMRHQNGELEIVAKGRASWVGWVELKTEPVNETSTQNTARVIHELDADMIAVLEAEARLPLRDFSRVMLRRVGGEPYAHSMLIQGNDMRGINVGLMTKEGLEFESERTHVFDLDEDGDPIFSRDCVEYTIRTPGGNELVLLVNHFKSKRGGGDERRLAQAKRVKAIVNERLSGHPNLVVLGDFNDTPDSTNLAPLLAETPLKDISTHDTFHDGGFPGTFGTQGDENKIDYILLSPALMSVVHAGGIFRQGVFSASKRWPFFDTIESKVQQASDHAAIWAELNLD